MTTQTPEPGAVLLATQVAPAARVVTRRHPHGDTYRLEVFGGPRDGYLIPHLSLAGARAEHARVVKELGGESA